MLTVRARAKGDLENLRDLLTDQDGEVEPYKERFGTDYPWRIRVERAAWVRVAGELAAEIDYSNFKDTVKARQGAKRAGVYSRIWGVLLGLEARGSVHEWDRLPSKPHGRW